MQKPKLVIPPILLEGDESPTPVASGPGQRYALGPTPPPEPVAPPAPLALPVLGAVATGEPELPEAYGTERLTITARDPHWLYAAWDLTNAQLANYNALSRDRHLTLRIHLDAVTGKPFLEIDVHPDSRNWFVHVGRGGARYVGELGYYAGAGDWVTVAVSKATLTPPDSLAEESTVQFANLPVEVPLPELVALVKEAIRDNVPLIEALQQLRAEGYPELPLIGVGDLPAAWTPEQERALAEVISMDSVRQVWVGSLEITELVRRQLERQISSVSAVPPGGPQEGRQRPFGREGLAAAVSSPLGGQVPPARGFWFNINAELILYGATEADAKVTIAGRTIQLRRDGSFSYRFALPDGRFELPAVAVSADQAEARHAELRFSRRTRYTGEVGAHPQNAALKPPRAENLT